MDNINEKIQEVLKANLYEDWEELMEKWNNVYFEVWQDIMKVIGSSLVIEFMERPEAESIMIIIRNNHIVHKLHEHLLLNEFVELIKSLETLYGKAPITEYAERNAILLISKKEAETASDLLKIKEIIKHETNCCSA